MGLGFSRLQGSKIHVILDTIIIINVILDTIIIINVTLVSCFVNECKRYAIFAYVFDVAFVLCFVNDLILA